MKRATTLTVCAFLILLAPAAGALDRFESPGADPGGIDPLSAYSYCRELASPKYAGRLTGDEGYTEAAQWAAKMLAGWGLEPLPGAGGYLLPFPCPYTIVKRSSMVLLHEGAGGEIVEIELRPLDDFLPMLFTDGGAAEAPFVFAGWGIHAPDLGYDDYEGIDATGRFVLCFRGTPDRDREEFEEHDHHRRRMETARSAGAAGLFYIYDEPLANPNGERIEGFLCGIVSEAVADTILAGTGLHSRALRDSLRQTRRPLPFAIDRRASFSAQVEHHPEGTGYNVAAMRPGSDPSLARSCVVIGAHLDHCGAHMGMIFPGAQDNASGSAVVMEIARAFARLDETPERSVVFILFGAEEMGLLGSYEAASFVAQRFDTITAMLNFDMVGQGDGTSCAVTPDPPHLRGALEGADAGIGTLRRVREITHVGVRSSDYAPFFLAGAPCAAFFSNGPHLFYHKPQDTIYRINPEILGEIARLGLETARRMARMTPLEREGERQ